MVKQRDCLLGYNQQIQSDLGDEKLKNDDLRRDIRVFKKLLEFFESSVLSICNTRPAIRKVFLIRIDDFLLVFRERIPENRLDPAERIFINRVTAHLKSFSLKLKNLSLS